MTTVVITRQGGAGRGEEASFIVETQTWSMPMVEWLLYNLRWIKERYEAMEPSITSKYVDIPITITGGGGTCKVVKVAIDRAIVSTVLQTVDRCAKKLKPEARKVYRLRFLEGEPVKGIAAKLHLSKRTTERRLTEIKRAVVRDLSLLPVDTTIAFWEKIDKWEDKI
jgi:hypothetical protein